MQKRAVRRVVGFDLFGTLARSAYMGPKYYELLQDRGFSAEYVSAVIRGQGMNFHTMNWDIQGERIYGEMSDGAGIREEYTVFLRKRLGNSFDMNPLAYEAVQAGVGFGLKPVDPEKIVDCWQAENNTLEWLPGSLRAIESLKSQETAVVLISNITVVGMWAVYEKLGPLISLFDQAFWSCDSPAAKPDPWMWQKVEKEFVCAEYWMVGDDLLIDLVMPAAMGWKTILVGGEDITIAEVPGIIRGER